jgi:nucleoside-diphosphate-sugar epimerase
MKILIIGANGFIGSNIVNSFVKNAQYEIHILIRKTSNIERLKENIDKVKIFYGDVRDKDSLIEPVKSADVIIHSAAVLRCIEDKTYYDVNYLGTKNLVETVVKHNHNLKKFIFLSSQAAAGPCEFLSFKSSDDEKCTPVSHYGKSKLLAEKELKKYSNKINIIILRPAAVYGPYDKDMFIYFKLAEKGMIPIFSKEFYIQFTYVYDLVSVIEKIVSLDNIYNKTFFIAEDKCYKIDEIKETFEKVVNKKIKIVYIPYLFGYVAAYLNEKFYKIVYKKPSEFNRDKLAELSKSYWLCESSEIKKYLPDFSYTPLCVGLKETYLWYRNNNWL